MAVVGVGGHENPKVSKVAKFFSVSRKKGHSLAENLCKFFFKFHVSLHSFIIFVIVRNKAIFLLGTNVSDVTGLSLIHI